MIVTNVICLFFKTEIISTFARALKEMLWQMSDHFHSDESRGWLAHHLKTEIYRNDVVILFVPQV